MKKNVTMKDIAKKVGVTQATVSYAFNQSGKISKDLEAEILNVANEMGYVPNANARNLKTRSTNIVGVLVPDISNGYYAELVKEIETFAMKAGYIMFLCNTFFEPELERTYMNAMISQNVAGIIIGYGLMDRDVLDCLKFRDIKVAVIDDRLPQEKLDEITKISAIEIDNIEAAKIAAGHLLGLRKNKICYASEPLFNHSLRRRQKGFCEKMTEEGIPEDEYMLFIEDMQYDHLEMGYNIASKILVENDIDAVFVSSDSLAYGITQKLIQHGKRIPEDILVVGFDDIPLSRYMTPKLTTIAQPKKEMAKFAVGVVLGEEDMNPNRNCKTEIKPHLIVRDSTLRI